MPTKKKPLADEPVHSKLADDLATKAVDLPEFGSSMMPRQEKKNKPGNILIAIVVLIIILAAGYFYFLGSGKVNSNGKYSAVFLTNGQVYFGHLVKQDSKFLHLQDVYYIQMQEQTQPALEEGGTPTTTQVPTLIKRGGELYAPEGDLIVNLQQVVAIEQVGENSPVRQQIKQLSEQPAGQ